MLPYSRIRRTILFYFCNILNLSPRRFEYLKKLEKQKKKNPPSSPLPTHPIGFLNLYLLNFDSYGISKNLHIYKGTKMRLIPLRNACKTNIYFS